MDATVAGNPSESVTWGLLIVIYPFITGIVAGAFVVSTIAHVFRRAAFKPASGIAMMISLTCLLIAPLPLMLDLGRPERSIGIFLHPNPSSPMAIFGYLLLTLMAIYAVEGFLLFRPGLVFRAERSRNRLVRRLYWLLSLARRHPSPEAERRDHRLLGILGVVTIPLVFMFHGYVGMLFGSIKSRPLWSTPLMPIVFILSALVSGVAAVMVAWALLAVKGPKRASPASPSDGLAPERALLGKLGVLLAVLVVIDVSAGAVELMQAAFVKEEFWATASQVYSGPLLWTLVAQVVVGALLPAGALAFRRVRHSRLGASLAALGALAGVFFFRWNVVIGGQLVPKMEETPLSYAPSQFDVYAALFVMFAGLAIFALLVKLLPWRTVAAFEPGAGNGGPARAAEPRVAVPVGAEVG